MHDDGVDDDAVLLDGNRKKDPVAADIESYRQRARARVSEINGNAAERRKEHVMIASHNAFQDACASVTGAAVASTAHTVLSPTAVLAEFKAINELLNSGFYNQEQHDAAVKRLQEQAQPKSTASIKVPGKVSKGKKNSDAAASDDDSA